jgi:pilus assembly protein Flp/PilA
VWLPPTPNLHFLFFDVAGNQAHQDSEITRGSSATANSGLSTTNRLVKKPECAGQQTDNTKQALNPQRGGENLGQRPGTFTLKRRYIMSVHFKHFCDRTRALLKNKKGQGLVEYALILVLIAVVVITAVKTLGTSTNSVFTTVGSTLKNPN